MINLFQNGVYYNNCTRVADKQFCVIIGTRIIIEGDPNYFEYIILYVVVIVF